MPVLLDTGAAELLRRRHRQVETLAVRHYPPLLCRHVIGEFLYGQLLAGAASDALLEAQEFLASFECLNPDEMTSLIYARVRADLKKAGRHAARPRLLDRRPRPAKSSAANHH